MRFRFLLIPLLALLFVAGAKKPQATVRFHLQANPVEGAPFVMEVPLADGRKVHVKRVPEISERDVVSIYPFQAADGSMGCAFKLDEHGRIALETFSLEDRGQVVVCMMNFRVVTAMLIDKPVRDGVIWMPSGLAPEEVAKLQERFPIMGETGKKKKRR